MATICEVAKETTIMSNTVSAIRFYMQHDFLSKATTSCTLEPESSLLPGLPDDIAKHCIALVPRVHFQSLGSVCKRWRQFIQSKEFYAVRKLAGTLEEWLYVLTKDDDDGRIYWQVLNSVPGKWQSLPPMPGPVKTAFGFVVMDGNLLVMGGLVEDDDGIIMPSADVYKYDSALNMYATPLIRKSI